MDDAVPAVADSQLAAFSEFLAERVGLYFPPKRWPDLEKAIGGAARDFSCKDAAGCMRTLMGASLTRSQIEILASHLTVGETYFFREKQSLDVLETQILPQLIAQRRQSGQRQLRIWSAGCCTGEEAYSIAILLSRLIADIRDWNIAILGTDINPHFLRKARRGAYSEWAFRDPPPWLKRDYFTRDSDGRFEILPAMKARVEFAYHNLAEDAYPSLVNHTNGMDVIFCRNVLMYFAPQGARRVVANLYRCLVDGGWLIVSPTEASAPLLAPFQAVHFPEAVLFRKAETRPLSASPAFLREPEGEVEERRTTHREPAPIFQSAAFPAVLPEAPPAAEPNAGESRGTTPAPDAWPEAARLCEQRSHDAAAEILSCLPAAGPADAKALALLARICANQGKLDAALGWCEKAIRKDRLDPATHYLKANILLEQGRFDEAAPVLKRVLYLDPDFVLAYFALGNLLKRQGKHREAARHFANALELLDAHDPHSVFPEAEGLTAGRLKEVVQAGRMV